MLIFALITSGGWLSVPLNATCYCCMVLIFNNYSKKKCALGMRWELAITISYPTRANGIIVLIIFFNFKRLVITTEF